jgi:hypothetical protein
MNRTYFDFGKDTSGKHTVVYRFLSTVNVNYLWMLQNWEGTTSECGWVVQAQTCSVGVWSVVLVAGRSDELSILSLHPTSAAQQRLFVHT